MRKTELTTLWCFPANCWLVNRHERNRFYKILAKWLAENPKATLIQEALAEDLIRLHLMEQRLWDYRYFFDGSDTGMHRAGPHSSEIGSDAAEQKLAEFKKYWPMIHDRKVKLYQLALANSIDIHLDGSVKSITEFFKAADDLAKGKENTTPAD